MPTPEQNDAERNDFLRVEDIGKGKLGAKGKITFLGKPGREIRSDYGQQMIFAVRVNGRVYDWPIRLDSGNHYRIADRFGTDVPKGTVGVTIKEFNDNHYIAID